MEEKTDAPKDETAWVMERDKGGTPEYIGVVDGLLGWTPDIEKALRVARRADTDALECYLIPQPVEESQSPPADDVNSGLALSNSDSRIAQPDGDGK